MEELSDLPDLVMLTVLKMLRSNISDIENLSIVNQNFHTIVQESYPSLYYTNLEINNLNTFNLNLDKPVLGLKVVCSQERQVTGEQDELNMFVGRPHSHAIQGAAIDSKSQTAYLKTLLRKLNLSMVRKLEIVTEGGDQCSTFPYHDIRNSVLERISLENLEELVININFMDLDCREFLLLFKKTGDGFTFKNLRMIKLIVDRQFYFVEDEGRRLPWSRAEHDMSQWRWHFNHIAANPRLDTIELVNLHDAACAEVAQWLHSWKTHYLGYQTTKRNVSFSQDDGNGGLTNMKIMFQSD